MLVVFCSWLSALLVRRLYPSQSVALRGPWPRAQFFGARVKSDWPKHTPRPARPAPHHLSMAAHRWGLHVPAAHRWGLDPPGHPGLRSPRARFRVPNPSLARAITAFWPRLHGARSAHRHRHLERCLGVRPFCPRALALSRSPQGEGNQLAAARPPPPRLQTRGRRQEGDLLQPLWLQARRRGGCECACAPLRCWGRGGGEGHGRPRWPCADRTQAALHSRRGPERAAGADGLPSAQSGGVIAK